MWPNLLGGQHRAVISPQCSAWLGFWKLGVEHGPMHHVPQPGVPASLPLAGEGGRGGWRVLVAADWESEINEVLSS